MALARVIALDRRLDASLAARRARRALGLEFGAQNLLKRRLAPLYARAPCLA